MSENERLRVLKLLEEGKINAEEAARLLEALGEPRRRGRGISVDLADIFEIPDVVCKSMRFAHPFTGSDAAARTEFAGKKRMSFKGVSGDLLIKGVDGDRITVRRDGIGHVEDLGDEVFIKTISGDVEIEVPRAVEVKVTGVSGDIRIENLESRTSLYTASGDIAAKNIKGDFTAAVVSGDVSLELLEVTNVSLSSRSGDITLFLKSDASAALDLYSKHGTVDCTLALDNKDQRKNSLRGTYHGGKGKIAVESVDGDISVGELAR